jgi:hypothetical protein
MRFLHLCMEIIAAIVEAALTILFEFIANKAGK